MYPLVFQTGLGDSMNTKLSIQIDLEQCRFEDFNPPDPNQHFLSSKVEIQTRSLSQLAKDIGYRNLSKGTRRIHQWISASTVPDTQQGNLFLDILEISRTELNQANTAHQEQIQQQRIYRENQFEQQLLRTHFDLLMTNAVKIIQKKQYSNAFLPKVGVFMYYAKVPSIRLGQLLDAWKNGRMQLEDFMAIRVVGSPLSGTHRAQGFHRQDLSTWLYKPQIFPRLNDVIKEFLPSVMDDSGWSLGQIVADLGGHIEPTQIFSDRDNIGVYDYRTRMLTLHNIEYDLTDLFQRPDLPVVVEQNHRSHITMRKQNLQIDGRILCHWNQDLPPIVAEQIVRILWG